MKLPNLLLFAEILAKDHSDDLDFDIIYIVLDRLYEYQKLDPKNPVINQRINALIKLQ